MEEKLLEEMQEKREKELKEALKKEEEKPITIDLTKEQLDKIFRTMKYKDGVKR